MGLALKNHELSIGPGIFCHNFQLKIFNFQGIWEVFYLGTDLLKQEGFVKNSFDSTLHSYTQFLLLTLSFIVLYDYFI